MFKQTILDLIDNVSSLVFSNRMNSYKTFHELNEIAYRESARFISENMSEAVLFDNIELFWSHAIDHLPLEGAILEFGVFKGRSINFFGKVLKDKGDNRRIYGFDSFEGLSENWSGTQMVKSTFTQDGELPTVSSNVNLIKGWVEATLPTFISDNIENNKAGIAFLHIDTDTYSPCKTVFENTIPFLKKGTIIVFDELLGYPGWKDHEYKALNEILNQKYEYEFISFCEPKTKFRTVTQFVRAAIRISNIKAATNVN